jgi:hypothetical protein
MKTDQFIKLLAQDSGTRVPDSSAMLLRWLPIGALAALAAFLVVLGVRSDLSAATYATTIKLSLGGLLAVTAGLGAMALARPDAPVARHAAPAGAAAIFLAALLIVDRSWLTMAAGTPQTIIKCLTVIPLLAAPPLAAFIMALRQGAVVRPALAGALAGLASAGLAILAYGLNCYEDSPLFIALWYGSAAAIMAGIGAVAGRRALAW